MYETDALRNELTDIANRRLNSRVAADGSKEPDGFMSDIDAALSAQVAVQDALREKGLDDGFFLTETADYRYPPLSAYDSERTRELGQLFGDVLITVNPGRYVDPHAKTLSLDTSKRKGPFVFEPLPTLASWEPQGDGSHSYRVADDGELFDMAGYDLRRCHMGENIWADIWAHDYPTGETLWTCELHVPRAKAPIAGMDVPGWFAHTWFEQNPTLVKSVRTYPQDTEHEAWGKIADWWLNQAYRYI